MPWGAVAGAVASSVVGSALADDHGGQGQMQQSSELTRQQAQIAQEQWDRYKQSAIPLEDQYIAESQGMGSEANQNKAAQTAAAGVAGTYASARERLNRLPGGLSQAARVQNELKLDLGEAAASAGAQTTARQGIVDRGRAATTDALSLMKGLPADSMKGLASASGGLFDAGKYMTERGTGTAAAVGKALGSLDYGGIKNWLTSGSGDSTGTAGSYTATANNPSAYVASTPDITSMPNAWDLG